MNAKILLWMKHTPERIGPTLLTHRVTSYNIEDQT